MALDAGGESIVLESELENLIQAATITIMLKYIDYYDDDAIGIAFNAELLVMLSGYKVCLLLG